MIKSTFSRNATKLPPSQSSKKPSLASLAQKLQGVDLSSTSYTDCTPPGNELSNTLLPNIFTDDGNGIQPDSGKYTRTSDLAHNGADHCSSVSKLIPENLIGTDPVLSPTSQPISSCGSVAACRSKLDGNISNVECSTVESKCCATSWDLTGSWNDCSVDFDRLSINPAVEKRCGFAKPTQFGRTLSSVPNPLNRANRRKQKAALYARFSYWCQMSAVAGPQRQSYSARTPTITPFDFSTPSPDDIVQEKQKLAFGNGKRTSAKRP